MEQTRAAEVFELGWDQLTVLLKATGRTPISRQEAARITNGGIRWLTLG